MSCLAGSVNVNRQRIPHLQISGFTSGIPPPKKAEKRTLRLRSTFGGRAEATTPIPSQSCRLAMESASLDKVDGFSVWRSSRPTFMNKGRATEGAVANRRRERSAHGMRFIGKESLANCERPAPRSSPRSLQQTLIKCGRATEEHAALPADPVQKDPPVKPDGPPPGKGKHPIPPWQTPR